MHIDLLYRPGNAVAKVALDAGEQLTAEAGAMIAMSGHMNITTTTHKKTSGGLFKAAKRMLGGESFFLNHYDTAGRSGEIWLGTAIAGDVEMLELQGQNLVVQSGSFLACDDRIDMDMGWQGFKTLLSGENLFWLNLQGEGKILLSAFGAIYPVEIDGEYIVDTGHIVAFDETLDFTISKAGKSWIHSFLGGEGLVCKFQGRGRIWCQSHNPNSFGKSLSSRLKARRA